MVKEVKFFLGAAKFFIADTPELKELGKAAARQGYQRYLTADGAEQKIRQTHPQIVHLAGGLTGKCLPLVAKAALQTGSLVVFHLRECRFGKSDTQNDIGYRGRDIYRHMLPNLRDNPCLTVQPENISLQEFVRRNAH
jgi:hypothetical protein